MGNLDHTDSGLPPESKGQPDHTVKDTPGDLGGEFIPVNQLWLYQCAGKKAEITYASYWGPNDIGINRGAWKRMVDTVVWYNERPMATARFPGRNSTKNDMP